MKKSKLNLFFFLIEEHLGRPRKMREYAINSEVKKETLKLMLQKFKNGHKRLL